MRKRMLLLAIMLAACLSVIPRTELTASPEEDFTISEGIITEYKGSEENVVIPETIQGQTVIGIGSGAFYQATMKTILLPEGLESIGMSAFQGCQNLESIDIPAGVTSIGINAFYSCEGMKAARIRATISSIPAYAFCNCEALESVIFPSGLTSIGDDAFLNCQSLRTISIPETVTAIGEDAFHNCTSLVFAELPDSVKTIGEYAFYGCPLVVCPNIANVTSIGASAFSGGAFTEVVIPASVESIDNTVFPTTLAKLTFAGFPSSIDAKAFQGIDACTLNLPATWTGELPKAGEGVKWAGGTFTVKRADTKNITVYSDGNGTAEADMAQGKTGTEVTLTAVPGTGYEFHEWIVISGGVTVATNKFTIGTEDVTIVASFKTVDASHKHTPARVAGQEATCTADGWKDFYQCSDATCLKLFSDPACTDEITLAAWKTGDGKIAATGHDVILIPEQNPTTEKDGVKAYWYCGNCKLYFVDNSGAPGDVIGDATALASWKTGNGKIDKLIAHEHTFANEWSTNASAHWHASTCTHDGYSVIKDNGAHDFDGGVPVDGGTKYTCQTCGYSKTVSAGGEGCLHEHLHYSNNKNGTHKIVCDDCGETLHVSAPCVYNRNGGTKCVCGAYNPSKADVKIRVALCEKTQRKFVGFWIFGYYKNVTVYTADIKTEVAGVMVTKVQYQLNGGMWMTGTDVMSDTPIKTLKVKAWDNNGKVYEYTYLSK